MSRPPHAVSPQPSAGLAPGARGKLASLVILLVAQVAAMGVWFSSSSVVAVIKQTHTIAAFDEALASAG